MEPILQVIPGCPNSESARELFATALELEGIAVPAFVREIRTDQEAALHDFHGSPSFSLNGADLFESGTEPAVSCRVYRTPSGFAGQPDLEDLRRAIRASQASPGSAA
ncbi:hypothetical protein KRR55_01930 [Paeniglutamicibacter sp. ABSL32-1]|uniref:hypothetical protein n=1 Tax=Paeniglutamicibacter quisquiliarum TaxID=2849498 RepID=UPI001C2DD629|nr:hypothetical protein [Paeniglutamicibacter quisquiliarum]